MRALFKHGAVSGLALLALAGCATQNKFADSVTEYNLQTEQAQDRALLLNVLRASKRRPLLFFDVSTVTGSSPASGSLAAAIPLAAKHATILQGITTTSTLNLSGGPSVAAAPILTQEFYQGMLKPISMSMIDLFVRRGFNRDLLFNLFFAKIEMDTDSTVKEDEEFHGSVTNYPSDDEKRHNFQAAVELLLDAGLTTKSTEKDATVYGPVYLPEELVKLDLPARAAAAGLRVTPVSWCDLDTEDRLELAERLGPRGTSSIVSGITHCEQLKKDKRTALEATAKTALEAAAKAASAPTAKMPLEATAKAALESAEKAAPVGVEKMTPEAARTALETAAMTALETAENTVRKAADTTRQETAAMTASPDAKKKAADNKKKAADDKKAAPPLFAWADRMSGSGIRSIFYRLKKVDATPGASFCFEPVSAPRSANAANSLCRSSTAGPSGSEEAALPAHSLSLSLLQDNREKFCDAFFPVKYAGSIHADPEHINMLLNRVKCNMLTAGNNVNISFTIRSTYDIIYYLGEVERRYISPDEFNYKPIGGRIQIRQNPTESNLCATLSTNKTPDSNCLLLFAADSWKVSNSQAKKNSGFINVDYDGDHYTVAGGPGNRTYQVMEIVTELVDLNRSSKDVPASSVLTLRGVP